jgi:hypothetical protein
MIQIQSTGKLLNYKDFRQYSDTFVETGTAAGDGVQRALDAGFEKVISIEAARKWFEQSGQRFLNNNKVSLRFGVSSLVLKLALEKIPLVIFLDAHPSGPESAGHADLMEKGGESEYQQDAIIKAELDIVLSHYHKHIIIIDDVNGLTDGLAVQYCEKMLKANPEYKFYFYDEDLSGNHSYKDKILVAIP